MDKLYYLASPFTHPDKEVMFGRIKSATNAAIKFLSHGIAVFAPIAYNGDWIREDVPGDWAFWEIYDKLFISKMDGVIVLTIDGWDKSVGVTAEIEYARSLGLPIEYVTMEQIETNDLDHIRLMHDYKTPLV